MSKFFVKFLAIASICCVRVSGQNTSPVITIVQTLLRDYNTSSLNSLAFQYNALRDDVYNYFYNAHSLLRDSQNNLFSASHKFPFHLLSDSTTRDQLSANVTNFLNNCTGPTIQHLEINSIIPLFNFTENNTTPIESTFKPIGDALTQISDAYGLITNRTCLELLRFIRINDGVLIPVTLDKVLNRIRDCIRSAFTAYRAPLLDFLNFQNAALSQLTRVTGALQACGLTLGDKNACVANLGLDLCSSPTDSDCRVCAAVQNLKNHSMNFVNQTQTTFNTCIQTVQNESPSEIAITVQEILNKIQPCFSSSGTIKSTLFDQDQDIHITEDLLDKIDEVRKFDLEEDETTIIPLE